VGMHKGHSIFRDGKAVRAEPT